MWAFARKPFSTAANQQHSLLGSPEFYQAIAYLKNRKFEKAHRILWNMRQLLREADYSSIAHVEVLRYLYLSQVKQGMIGDGELSLKNIREIA